MLRLMPLLFLLTACVDATDVTDPDAQADLDAAVEADRPFVAPPPDAAVRIPDAAVPDAAILQGDAALPEVMELTIQGQSGVRVGTGEIAALTVRYTDAEGAPIEGARVSARIMVDDVPTAQVEGSFLAVANVLTSAQGDASLRLQGGPDGAAFEVEATAPGAEPVRWQVTVAGDDQGVLVVELGLSDPVLLSGTSNAVTLYGQGACEAVMAGAPPAPVAELPPVNALGVETPATRSGPLMGGLAVSVYGVIWGRDGDVLGRGCVDDIVVQAAMEQRVLLPIVARPVTHDGIYDTIEVLDFAALVPGGESPTLQRVAEIGGGLNGSRGSAIISLLCDVADLSTATCIGLNVIGADEIIDAVIENNVSESVLVATAALGDVYRVMRSMEVYGAFVFPDAVPQNGIFFDVLHRLIGLHFTWREGCPGADLEACTFDIPLSDDRLGLGFTPETALDVTLRDDLLSFGQHTLELPVEHIGVLLAESWILPVSLGVEGPVTIEALAAQLLPCEALAAQLAGVVPAELCEAYFPELMAELIRDEIGAIGAGVSRMTLQGEATRFVRGFRVERLDDGSWFPPVGGTFDGCLQGAACGQP